jgi:GH43 family beta-xylosidase
LTSLQHGKLGGPVTDHGVAIRQEDIRSVWKQLWASDAAIKNGKTYIYFQARESEDIFELGVRVGDMPERLFELEPETTNYETFNI